ncbi:unnamed protein product [Lupinus luteus]|uniref:Uncharacterized protein n=1 Tax=Lupinus luteus TaxID=3873 RepID=A0AAV1YHG9_LUPLU
MLGKHIAQGRSGLRNRLKKLRLQTMRMDHGIVNYHPSQESGVGKSSTLNSITVERAASIPVLVEKSGRCNTNDGGQKVEVVLHGISLYPLLAH